MILKIRAILIPARSSKKLAKLPFLLLFVRSQLRSHRGRTKGKFVGYFLRAVRAAQIPRASRPSAPGAVLAGTVCSMAAAVLLTGCGAAPAKSSKSDGDAAGSAGLPQVTTFAKLTGATPDSDPFAAGDGTVVHPTAPRKVHAAPDGPVVGMLPATQLGSPTWVPVIGSKPGWHQVLLPSRPNRATGWITSDGALKKAHSPYLIKVETSARRLVLLKSGKSEGSWKVAVGAPKTPTPTGRTFLLASLSPSKPKPSPLILPVGAHSDTLDSFGGGPGTVAFHGWPDESVFGKAVTHGCVRVPPDALKILSRVPLGSPVLITS
jgi:lipoprotein-anchoring transpeptidase ErfK/SrfK